MKKLGIWVLATGMCVAAGCNGAPAVVCGDGVVGGGETCDDGNDVGSDGCSSGCVRERGYACETPGAECTPNCNDGVLVDAEVCDPSVSEYYGYCASDCSMITGSCGDGTVQSSEVCDDTNGQSTDGCNVCHAAFGWDCDAATATCDASDVDRSLVVSSLTADQRMTFCEWQIGFLGPAGRVYPCGGTNFTVRTVSDCVTALATLPASVSRCSVGDFESWTAQREDACDFFTDNSAVCAPASAPNCSQLDISCSTARPTCDANMVPEVEASGLCWTGICVPQTSCRCSAYFDCPSGMCDTAMHTCQN
jgi:cysteine-rich repeat protein